MNRFYFRDLLESNPKVFSQMLAFNTNANPRMPNIVNEVLAERVKNDADLMRIFQRQGKTDTAFQTTFWEFGTESERLALWPAAMLNRLGKIMAASAYGEDIANSLRRADVLRLREFFGEDLYHYALVRGRYQAGSVRVSLTGIFGGDDLPTRCENFAGGALASLRAGWNDALKNKTATLFKEIGLPEIVPSKLDNEKKQQLWYFAKKLLVREFDQEWTHYFA